MNNHYVIIDILEPMIYLSDLKTMQLSFQQKCEIIRQTFDLFDRDFTDIANAARGFLKLPLIFSEQIPQHCIDELTSVCNEVVLNIFFNVFSLGLLNNYNPQRGFPFFIEHITSNSAYLRMEQEVSFFPY